MRTWFDEPNARVRLTLRKMKNTELDVTEAVTKRFDQYVPNVNPNPRMELTATKAAEWAVQKPPSLPVKADMYNTTSLLNSYGYKGDRYVVGQGAQI